MMKTVQVMLLILFISGYTYASDYTLDDCIKAAMDHNATVKKYQNMIYSSDYALKGLKSAFWPSIKLSGSYSHSYDDQSGLENDSYSASLNLNQLLFNGLQRWNNYEIGRLEKQKAENNFFNSKRDVVYTVKENYFKILLCKTQLAVYEKILERRQESLTLIRLKYNSGKEKLSSVKEMQSDLEDTKYSLEEKAEELKLTKIKLAMLMNISISNDYDVKETGRQFTELDLRTVIEQVKQQDPSLNIARLNLQIEKYNLKLSQGEYFPDINLTGSYGNRGESFFPENNSWSVGVNVSLPVFSGFDTGYKVRKMEYNIKAKEEEVKETENDLDLKLFDLFSRYALLRKKLELVKMQYDSAYESYRIINLEYKQGISSYDWLQQKEAELVKIELDQENMLYNLRLARADIEKYITGEE